jgi:hypothetical protein
VIFNDLAEAQRIYNLLNGFADGMGAWRFVDVLGQPFVELPEPLANDLMTLRWLRSIAETIKAKKDRPNNGE